MTATGLLYGSFGCLGCIEEGGLERVMEMCEGTILGEVVAAGVATVESRRSPSDKL